MKPPLSSRLPIALGAIIFTGGSLSQIKPFWQAVSQSTSSHEAVVQAPRKSFAVDVSESLQDQGQNRTYYLHTPAADSPLPLVVALHGSGMQGKEMADKTALSKLADQKGFVVIYPDGLQKKWNVSGKASEDNVAFVHALIRQVQQVRSIDPQRIYVVGLSNGGILAQKLACEAPNDIAAIATVAASLPTQFSSHCQMQKPISLLMVNGTADDVVPWQGSAAPNVHIGRNLSIPAIPSVIDFWQKHNSCSSQVKIEQVSDLIQVTDYQSCAAKSEVMLVTLKGAGHVWSGGGYGRSPFGDTTERVWQFLQGHSLQS